MNPKKSPCAERPAVFEGVATKCVTHSGELMSDIVSIDLAIDSSSIGLCVIQNGEVRFPALDAAAVLALAAYHQRWRDADGGDAAAASAAAAISSFIVGLKPNAVVIDGPQGFARVNRGCRRAEAILRTSGRTGPDYSLPVGGFSWPGIARLGVKLFNHLHASGYPRLVTPSLSGDRAAVEVFPDSCWHSFGLDTESLIELRRLSPGAELTWHGSPNEHQLDAAAGALTVFAARRGKAVFVGHPFFVDAGVPREGYIVIPDPGSNWLVR